MALVVKSATVPGVSSPQTLKPSNPNQPAVTLVVSALSAAPPRAADDAMKCERCGADMYRMHAVWRCPSCRFKTDCCGW
jgi:hypothetical protein